ncbi:hypothetical protein [Paraburkholderia sp. J41]|uniref:hypothetical protein n=1 Tax=Paraburkholderia sp. J41 TaxID=2805433 RepID=UPI002AC357E3|nr:hypothetical protein [Paraburkholderia sp. J41]
MLAIWTLQDEAATAAFCDTHAQQSGERLNPSNVKLYFSETCPYPEFDFARIEITPHILTRAGRRSQISSRCVSYGLLRKPLIAGGHAIIPFQNNSESLYHVNGILQFRVSETNILSYITLYGHIVSNPPFYFISRTNQVSELCARLNDSDRNRVFNSIEALFKVDEKGSLDIPVKKAEYFLLGNTLSILLPCLHAGTLYTATVKMAANGMPDMVSDNPLQVEGLFDDEPNFNYYVLDKSEKLTKEIDAYARKSIRASNITIRTLHLDSLLNMWILPLFAFHLFVILALGLEGNAVFDYFERIRQSTLLTISAFFIGIIGTAISIFRYVFLELTNFLRKLVPSVWSYLAAGIEQQSKNALATLGYPAFFVINALEHSFKILMNLSLLVYGVDVVFKVSKPILNFGQSISIVLANIPLVGALIQKVLFHTPFQVVLLPTPISHAVAWFVGFLFSTVFVGLLTRLFLLTRDS